MAVLIVDVSLRVIIAAAAVGLVLTILRVRSGAVRHAAWSAVLLAMMGMPLLIAIVPAVSVPVPPALTIDLVDSLGVDPPALGPLAPQVKAPTPGSVKPFGAAPRARDASSVRQVGPVLFTIYLAGVLFFVARFASGWLLARRMVSAAAPTTLANVCPVLESAAVAAPLTAGILRPAIILPVEWTGWDAPTLAAVLAHENAHVARRDALVARLAQLNRAIFWFHPVAWWLERALAVTAEHACDEIAARATGEPRRYAQVLLEMADAVRLSGRRVRWQAVGVGGCGRLGARIDRLLRADVLVPMSFPRQATAAAACAAVLLLAIACRQQIAATPLREDAEVAKTQAAQQARAETWNRAAAMTLDEARALEARLAASPADVESREKLITFYRVSDKPTWPDKRDGLRRHALWLIAHQPDGPAGIPAISPEHDPDGYAEAKRLWLEQTRNQTASAKTLANAAAFFSRHDKAIAEELLLRGRTIDPDSTALNAAVQPGLASPGWSSRLGELYARAIAGNIDPTTSATDPAEAASPFAQSARRKLEATNDPVVLTVAGSALIGRFNRSTPDAAALGRTSLERVLLADPQHVQARTMLAGAAAEERRRTIAERLRAAGATERFDEFNDKTYQAVSALSPEDRLAYLPHAAESAYMRAESVEFTARQKDAPARSEAEQRAKAGWARARQYARDALTVADAHREAPDASGAIYRANVVLAVLALKDGDRGGAVEHMRRAGEVPPSDAMRYMRHYGLRGRLVEYLLRAGERESVAAFLEKSAELSAPERDRLLADAASIRQGVMPQSYQYAAARR